MLPPNIFHLLAYLAVAASLSSANADPTEESRAGVALAGKIKCEDFRKNPERRFGLAYVRFDHVQLLYKRR